MAFQSLTFPLCAAVLITSFGGWFGLGFTIGQINSSEKNLLKWICETRAKRIYRSNPNSSWCESNSQTDPELNLIWGLMGSLIYAGCFLAAFFTGPLVSNFGTKKTLIYCNCIALCGVLLEAPSFWWNYYETLLMGRFLLGIHGGISLAVIPAYIAEISPKDLRGDLGCVPGLNLVFGLFVGVLLGVPQVLGTPKLWPYLFLIRLSSVIVNFVGLPLCPESPAHLYMNEKDHEGATTVLVKLRGRENVADEVAVLKAEEDMYLAAPTVSFRDIIKDRCLRNSFLLVFVLLLTQQFSGISSIFLYSTSIFRNAGLDEEEALFGSVGLMATQLLTVISNILLSDKVGRRPLVLIGHFGSMLSLLLCVLFMSLDKAGICRDCHFGTLVAMFAFIVLHNLGPAWVTWIIVPELFEQAARGTAMTVAVLTSNASGLIISLVIPVIDNTSAQWTFLFFAGFLAGGFSFLYFRLIETKERDFLQIQAELHKILN